MEDSPFYLASITLGHLNWPTSCTEPDDCRRGRRRHRQSEHFLLNANERVSDTIAPIITENTSLISSLTHPFTSTSPSFSTHFPSLPAAQSNSQAEQQYQQQNPLHSCPPQLRKHSLKHTFSTSSKSPYLRLRPPSISDLNQTSTTSTRTSISTLIATSTPTSSMQPTRSRITIKNKLPRFTMHSLLLFSSLCLLILLCNTVPTASASSLTRMVSRSVGSSSSNNNNNPGFSGLSSFPSSSSSSFSRRSEPVLHDSDPSGLFGGLVGEDDNSTLMKCAYYNRTQCTHHGTGCGDSYQVCHRHDGPDQNSLCYALWKNTTQTGVVVEFKGCWLGQSKDCIPKGLPENHEADQCVQTSTPNANNKKAVGNGTVKSHLYFCCCNGSKCNKKLKHVPVPEADLVTPVLPPPEPKGPGEDGRKSSFNYPFYVLFSFGIIFFAVVIGVFVFLFGKRRNKPNSGDILQTHQPLLDGSNFNGNFGLSSITLKEIRAQGKFGSVWMASDGGDNMVAVKVFAMQDRNSWQTEKDVFSLPQMKHNNILTFLGAERRGEGIETQYWLVTEYHPNGSLWDYLKSHTVNLNQLLTIVQGIGAGLTHLHEELSPTSTERGKPSIAHRDFKSKNVLLGSKFRPCIADFGLAIVFNPNAILGDAHGQVGTRRYMAPEVLEGAINFNRESFLRIDMYACGLVLWELLSRTSFGEITCGEYRLPFEEEVGPHPSLEDMQVVVSQEKKRPILLDTWFKHPTMAVVANTVQDCWDQDTEARISASTICERINALILAKETEESCLSLNNQNGTAAYRASVPFTGNGGVATSGALPANGIVSSGMGSVGGAVLGSAKNAFLMTAHPTAAVNGMNSTVTANGSVYAVRETST